MKKILLPFLLSLMCAWSLAAQTTRSTLVSPNGQPTGTQANPVYISTPSGGLSLDYQPIDLLQNVTGNITGSMQGVAAGSLVLTVNCASCAGGTTVWWEGSADSGSHWFPVDAREVGLPQPVSGLNFASSTTQAGLTYWAINTAGLSGIRAKVTNYGSGTVNVNGLSNQATTTGSVYLANATAVTPLEVTLAHTTTNGNVLRIDANNSGVVLRDGPGVNTASVSSSGAVKVDGSAVTQPVSVSSLPSHAVTNAGTFAVQVTSAPTTTVTGTVTANAGTNLNTSALALDATLTGGTQKTKLVDTGGTNVATISAGGALKVDGSAATQPVSGTVTVTQGTGSNLHITCDSGCSGSAGFADNAAFTFGTTAVNPLAGVFDDVASNTATENSAAVARITQNKALHVNFRNASGTEIGTSSNPIQVSLANTAANATAVKVDGSAVTQPVSGTVTANAGTNLNTSALALDATLTGRTQKSQVTDGTRDGTVKASSTAALTTDTALVVAISPNNTPILPSGASTLTEQQTQTTALQLIDNLPNTLGSTTSGQSGALALGAVTTGAPTYTTAQTNALSLTTAGSLRVDGSGATQPVSGTVSITSNSAVNISQMNGVTVTMGNGTSGTGVQRVTLASDSTGQVALAAGAATIGALTANQSINLNQINGAAVASPDANSYVISPNAATATAGAAASSCNILSTASTNATNCKASAGNFYGYEIYNTTTTVYYLRLYNLTTSPTCSSATGFIRTVPIPPAAAAGGVGGAVSNQVVGVNFSTGIGYCITAGSSSTDNTSAAAGVFGEIRYK